MRAVSVNVNEVTGVAGFVAPGTRVDVLATVNFSGSNEPRNVTILQNVKVLASDQHLDHGGSVGPARVVTLLALPEDAEKLALATQEGHIQLTLRNGVDAKQETTQPIGNENLYGTPTRVQPRVPRVKRTMQPVPAFPNIYEIEILGGPQRETIKIKQ